MPNKLKGTIAWLIRAPKKPPFRDRVLRDRVLRDRVLVVSDLPIIYVVYIIYIIKSAIKLVIKLAIKLVKRLVCYELKILK